MHTLSPYRIPTISHKEDQKFQTQTSMRIQIVNMTLSDLKWPQMTPKDLK